MSLEISAGCLKENVQLADTSIKPAAALHTSIKRHMGPVAPVLGPANVRRARREVYSPTPVAASFIQETIDKQKQKINKK